MEILKTITKRSQQCFWDWKICMTMYGGWRGEGDILMGITLFYPSPLYRILFQHITRKTSKIFVNNNNFSQYCLISTISPQILVKFFPHFFKLYQSFSQNRQNFIENLTKIALKITFKQIWLTWTYNGQIFDLVTVVKQKRDHFSIAYINVYKIIEMVVGVNDDRILIVRS